MLVSIEGGRGPGARRSPGTGSGPARFHVAARGLGYGAASGLTFGVFFLFIRNAGASSVLWPVCLARVAGHRGHPGRRRVARHQASRPRRRALGAARPRPAPGILDATANVCYVLATRAGLFGIAVVITSLYPGITVLLARVMLGERMRRSQRLGLVLAAAGVCLVTF